MTCTLKTAKCWWKRLRQINGKMSCVHELEDFMPVEFPHYPSNFTDSVKLVSKSQLFFRNEKKVLKFVWKHKRLK
jgi:hypothetical protein